MNNLCYTLLFSLLVISNISAQNNRTGSFVANDPVVYPISGDVTMINNAGVITVNFESNFATVQGITLEVFLAKTKTLNLSTDVVISTMPLDQGTPMNTPITGSRSFTVPAGINPYDFDNVLVWCTSANLLWGHANICDSNLNLSNSFLSSDTYRAEQVINSTAEVAPSADVIFETANCINLDAGFCVPGSSNFTTFVGATYGCTIIP